MKAGEKGKKYGLQVPAVRLGLGRGSKAVLGRKKAAVLKPSLGIFANDEDEGEGEGEGEENSNTMGAQIAAQQRYAHSIAKNEDVYKEALAQDPTVFEYDEVYDGFHSGEKRQAQEEKLNRQSKYIADLKAKASEREREQDMAYERRMAKDAQKEGDLHGDKEKFITSSYRKKLEEEKKWVERERVREEEEKRNDVTKKKNLGDFYKNLLTNNVSFGAKPSVGEAEIEKEGEEGNHEEERSTKSKPQPERKNFADQSNQGGGFAASAEKVEERRERKSSESQAARAGGQGLLAAAGTQSQSQSHPRPRQHLEKEASGPGNAKGNKVPLKQHSNSEPFIAAATFKGVKDDYVYKKGPLGLGYYLDDPSVDFTKIQHQQRKGDLQGPTVAAAVAQKKEEGKKRNREEIANAARQRYLERKQQRGAAN